MFRNLEDHKSLLVRMTSKDRGFMANVCPRVPWPARRAESNPDRPLSGGRSVRVFLANFGRKPLLCESGPAAVSLGLRGRKLCRFVSGRVFVLVVLVGLDFFFP